MTVNFKLLRIFEINILQVKTIYQKCNLTVRNGRAVYFSVAIAV